MDMAGRLSYSLTKIRPLADQVRRRLEQLIDQMATVVHRAVFPSAPVPPFDGVPRLAIVTVNFSTTRWLKLMLLTLAEQDALHKVTDIVVVDNDSRDGGAAFVKKLAQCIGRVRAVENRHFLSHARGMRLGIGQLNVCGSNANVILALDTDVVFLRPDTLSSTLTHFAQGASLVAGGEASAASRPKRDRCSERVAELVEGGHGSSLSDDDTCAVDDDGDEPGPSGHVADRRDRPILGVEVNEHESEIVEIG